MTKGLATSVAGTWDCEEGLNAGNPASFWPVSENALAGVPGATPGKAAPEDNGTVGLGPAKEKALAATFPNVPNEAAPVPATKGTFCFGLANENTLGVLVAGVPDERVPCFELPMENAPIGATYPGIPDKPAWPADAGIVCFEKAPTGSFEVPNETGPGCNGPLCAVPGPGNENAPINEGP